MIDTFLEAAAATSQPCTVVMTALPLLAVFALRAAWWAVGAAVAAAIIGGWLLAVSTFVLDGWPLRASGVVIAGALALGAGRPRTEGQAPRRHRSVEATTAAVATLAASMWWRPCVGIEFGRLLTAAQTDPLAQFPGIAVYMVGTMLPAMVAVLVWHALAPSARIGRLISATALGAASLMALAVALGHHDAVATPLT